MIYENILVTISVKDVVKVKDDGAAVRRARRDARKTMRIFFRKND